MSAERNGKYWLWFAALLATVILVYSNHFQNAFHFDDSHTIVQNPWIRDLRNVPRFFTDAATFSTLPANRVYRPLVQTALAVDYRLGGGLKPFWFHASNLFWFAVQLGAMLALFRATLGRVDPGGTRARWAAIAATAIYGLHPVMAETVNYLIQRGDIYSTLGVVAGLAIYAAWPRLRRYGVYLAPVALAMLAKPPAVVFCILLAVWIRLFEDATWGRSVLRSAPAMAVCGALMALAGRMNPPSFTAGGVAAYGYRITQPAVLLGYFGKFFVPAGLSADTDRVAFDGLNEDAIVGMLFLAAVGAVAYWCSGKREYRPIAFGAVWFLVASIPTSIYPLAEVENDHRMYFPFVGLALAVCWAVTLVAAGRRVSAKTAGAAAGVVLAGFAWGAHERNEVWRTEESLWKDVTVKSPRNGRGLMNYGLTLMERGDYKGALDYFTRALALNPNYYILETNLGIANGGLGNVAEAERHFARSVELAPNEATSHFFYARWLNQMRRGPEAMTHLRLAAQFNPDYMDARYLLMQVEADAGDVAALRAEAQSVLQRFPADAAAQGWLARSLNLKPAVVAQSAGTPEAFLNQSLALYQARDFKGCIAAAREALKLRPDYAEAWNNIAAAYNSMEDWDAGIAAAKEAVRLKPDFQLARNNLAWALGQKGKKGR